MSDVSQGPGWWQAADGKWYPPKESEDPPAPGWWLASDGKWYPPQETAEAPAPGWWLAADGKWYPPADQARAAAKPTKAAAKPVKAVPVKAVPAKAVPKGARPVPAKAVARPAGAAAASPKPAGAKPAGAKPAGARPAPGRSAAAPKPTPPPARHVAPAATAADQSRPVTRHSAGMSPEQQIRMRDEQARQTNAMLAKKRATAATRAIKSLESLIEQEKAASATGADPAPATPAPAAPAPTAKATPASAVPAATTPAAATSPNVATTPAGAPAAAGASTAATEASSSGADARPRPTNPPLLEVKPSALGSDLDRIGERLVIFSDRVELHDRNDRVRQVIYGQDIADVVVHKKFTGSTVTVESGSGESIVAKGLKPEQADEIRALILKRTRQGVAPDNGRSGPPPAAARPASASAPRPDATTAPAVPSGAPASSASDAQPARPAATSPAVNEADLLKKLADLHRAGVLTDVELEEKSALVARLARGETLASTPH